MAIKELISTEEVNSQFLSKLPARLSGLLEKTQITNYILERLTGYSRANFGRIINGTVTPTAVILAKLSTLFCVSADWLIGLSDDDRFTELYRAKSQAFLDDPNIPAGLKLSFLHDEAAEPERKAILLLTCIKMVEEMTPEEREAKLNSDRKELFEKKLKKLLEIRTEGEKKTIN